MGTAAAVDVEEIRDELNALLISLNGEDTRNPSVDDSRRFLTDVSLHSNERAPVCDYLCW